MATAAKFRIDVALHDLLRNAGSPAPSPLAPKGLTLPEPIFPRHPELLKQDGPSTPPERREWSRDQVMRQVRGWLLPYLRSRVLPGDFHPMAAYLFAEYKCNLDCWYCWSFDNRVSGMTEDTARRAIDWLYERGCRVLGLMGGEPLWRPQFAHKVVDYAAQKGFWVYLGTNGRLLRPDAADRLGDAGVACFNLALDAWSPKPGLPKALTPVQRNLEYILRKQYVYGYLVLLNINICRNNLDDVRRLTEYAHEHRVATDYHLNETPMLEQDEHFKHLDGNPTYLGPEDWPAADTLIDWIIEKNQAGYQMVNSVRRLRAMKAFMRLASGVNLARKGWDGNCSGAAGDLEKIVASKDGMERGPDGKLRFAGWSCRGGQNSLIIRTDGTLGPCFPMYAANHDWGNVDEPKLDPGQLKEMKRTCEHHCYSTFNHNLSYCYHHARVLKWLWKQARNRFGSGARSFEE